jgi:2-amino-4-hydroxy-6-hydroxymethyldihydropteridine diphosphokinase
MALASLPRVRLAGVSRLYRTAPVGVLEQPDFLNAAVALDVPAGPDPESGALDLLAQLKDIERGLGRKARARWGPREIDLDLLLFGRARIRVERPPDAMPQLDVVPQLAGDVAGAPAAPETTPLQLDHRSSESAREVQPVPPPRFLEVPHRDVADRLFVLAPLNDLAPRLVPPGWRETVRAAMRRREEVEGPGAVEPVGRWAGHGWRPIRA